MERSSNGDNSLCIVLQKYPIATNNTTIIGIAQIFRFRKTSNDFVPAWDFDDPSVDAPKDASAACVVASALLELSGYVGGEKGKEYQYYAEQMLMSLSQNYQCGDRCVAFLLHSTGHHPAGSEIDASIIYADYYYYEALLRLRRLQQGKPVLGIG